MVFFAGFLRRDPTHRSVAGQGALEFQVNPFPTLRVRKPYL